MDDDEESEDVECDDDCGDDGMGASRVGEAGDMLTESVFTGAPVVEVNERCAGFCAAAKKASIGVRVVALGNQMQMAGPKTCRQSNRSLFHRLGEKVAAEKREQRGDIGERRLGDASHSGISYRCFAPATHAGDCACESRLEGTEIPELRSGL